MDAIPRFLLYSHDAFGFGHTRRNLAIASALRRRHLSAPVLVASSIPEANRLGLPRGSEILYLPSLKKIANESYGARNIALSAGDILGLRSSLMLAAVTSFRPDVLLVDKHPLGIQEELVPALDEQRRHGRSCVLGLREILDEPDVVRREWSLYGLPERIADYHDRVLVYGHPHVFDPVEAYAFPPTVTPRVRYCGIVLNQDGVTARKEDLQTRRGHVRPTVLATVGGGEDGKQILETFIAACVGAPWDGIVVAGTMMQPSDRESLARIASEANIEFHVFVSGLSEWYERVDAVVCMGGYNTLAEALHKSVPTVCIPRIYPRKEQLMRATALADLGLLRMLDPSQLSVAALREAISIALVQPRDQLEQRINAVLDFTGADRVAVELLDLVGTKFGEAVMSGDATVG